MANTEKEPEPANDDATDADTGSVSTDPVEELFHQLDRQVQALTLVGEPSLALRVSEVASKSLLLAAASRFESELTELIREAAFRLSESSIIAEFCVNQGLMRKFHTMFDWERNNANKFFRLFGEDFLEQAKDRALRDEVFEKATVAFLNIGNSRNTLVHSDFVSFPLTDTLAELIAKYREARQFLVVVRELLIPDRKDAGVDVSDEAPRGV